MTKPRTLALVAIALSAVALSGCHKPNLPFLGHWSGKFELTGESEPADAKALVLGGYLQLYQTGSKAILDLTNKAQHVNIVGTWKLVSPKRAEVRLQNPKIDMPPLDQLTALKEPFLDPTVLQDKLTVPIILDLSTDKNHLTGLLTTIGPLKGRFVFTRGDAQNAGF